MTIVTDDRVTGCKSAIIIEDNHLFIQGSQDVTAIQEYNAAHRAMHDTSGRCAPDGELAGSVPLEIMTDLQKKGIWQDDDALLAWFELPENKDWKMHPGKFA